MGDQELRKLGRKDLLELLLDQAKELERVRAELDEAKKKLEERRIVLNETGSIAEASLRLNEVFRAAQEACAQYTFNVEEMHRQQKAACEQMERETREKCEKLQREAREQADAYWAAVCKRVDKLMGAGGELRRLMDIAAEADRWQSGYGEDD